jgi:hypothetical protein
MSPSCSIPECSRDVAQHTEIHVLGFSGSEQWFPRIASCVLHGQLIDWWNRLLPRKALRVANREFEPLDAAPLRRILGREPFVLDCDDTAISRLIPDSPDLDGFLLLLRALQDR